MAIDSLIVVNLLKTSMVCFPSLSMLVCDCRELLHRTWQVISHQTQRESNKCADCRLSANQGRIQQEGLLCYDICLSFLLPNFVWDIGG